MGLGVEHLGGPLAFYALPREEQALALAWYCTEKLPSGWRSPNRAARGERLARNVKASPTGRAFWLGG